MAQVLNVQDEVIDGEAKYIITDNSDGTKNIKLANEVVNEGTALNRTLFNKIDLTINYQSLHGTYDSDNQKVKYIHDCFNESEVVNGQKICVKCGSMDVVPADSFEVIQDAGNNTIADGYNTFTFKLSSENIIALFLNPNSSGFPVYIYTNNGKNVTVKSFSDTIYPLQAIKLTNGNILIVGNSGSSNYYLEYMIIDEDANIVKELTKVNSKFTTARALEMSNGNIMIVGSNTYSSGNAGYEYIIDNTGTQVKEVTSIGSNLANPRLIEMANGNILIVGTNASTTTNYVILNQSGTTVKAVSTLGENLGNGNIIKMDNDNIFIVGGTKSASGGVLGSSYYSIISQDGTIIKSSTALSTSGIYYYLYTNVNNVIKLSNGNIMVIDDINTILDEDGNILCSINDNHINYIYDVLEMSNGNVIAIGYAYSVTTGTDGHISIIDSNNGKELSHNTITKSLLLGKMIELSNKNIVLTSRGTSINEIIKPINVGMTNTLNTIPIDTALQEGNYYDLVYDEEQNKFVGEERF